MRLRTRRTKAVGAAVAALVITAVVVPDTARAAAVGALTQRSQCFAAATTGCTARAEMSSPWSVAVSPDGHNVYVANFGGSLTVFKRSSTGALTPLAAPDGCLTPDGDGVGCTKVVGMSQPSDVVVSRDGRSVYVSDIQGALLVFARNTSTGALERIQCLKSSTTGCSASSNVFNPLAVAVAPDGKTVYTADSGLMSFTRSTTTGLLTESTCVSAACAGAQGVDHAADVAVSPDNATVYVASRADDTLTAIHRNVTTGSLTSAVTCYGATTGCTAARGLDGVRTVAVSPNGRSVYAGGSDPANDKFQHGVLAVFNRSTVADSTHGDLTQKAGTAGCVSSDGVDDHDAATCSTARGVGGVRAVGVSPDNANVYVAGWPAPSLAALRRGTSGSVSQPTGAAGCVSDDGRFHCADGRGLRDPLSLAFSPGVGAQVYVASTADLDSAADGVTIFNRHLYPDTTITRGPSGRTSDHTPTFRFKSSDAGSTFQCRLSGGSFHRCSSPITTHRLAKGKHRFFVRAINSAGYRDPTPASRRFTVV